MGRSPCCSKIGLNRGSWTASEDQILTAYIKAHGEGNWRKLPKKAGLKRCGKSCRLRWMNYLKPGIKRGNISPEEEDLIIRLHSLLGNRWSLIAGRLPGRTDNEIKNYWNTTLSKRIGAPSSSSSAKCTANKSKPSKSKARKPPEAEAEAKATGPNVPFSPAAIRTKAHRFTKTLIPNAIPPTVHADAVLKSATVQNALNQIQEQLNQEIITDQKDLELFCFSFSDYQLPAIDNIAMADRPASGELLEDINLIDLSDLMASFLDQEL